MTRNGALRIAGLLLLLTMAGCRHKVEPPPPPPPSLPPITPATITVITPLPSVPVGASARVQPEPPPAPVVQPVAKPVKRKRRTRRHPSATTSGAAQTAQTAQTGAASGLGVASTAIPPVATPAGGVTPASPTELTPQEVTVEKTAAEAKPTLGELSAGTTISTSERSRILGEIERQETRFGKMKEATTPDTRAIHLQVRSFLVKARQALADNDLDGALTLNTKARVLLDELLSE